MVSPAVIRYLEWVKDLDWVDMEWYALPYGQEVWVLGRREYVLLWSKKRQEEQRLGTSDQVDYVHGLKRIRFALKLGNYMMITLR